MVKADNLVGQVVGDYRISVELPSQSALTLYLGESEIEPGRQVILKLYSSHLLSAQVDKESFLHEARMLQRLEHPHILPTLNYGLIHDLPYIVTPYTSWRPLSTHIRRHWSPPFALPQTLLLISQLGAALSYAHQQHLFHGQLTPRCVLLDDQQRPLLTDFRFTSLATRAASTQDSHPESAHYLAPEQRAGLHKKESDQYALACIAYELLTGRRPAPVATNAQEDIVEPLVAPSALNPTVSATLDAAILKALSVSPEQQFGSLREFLAALPQSSEEPEPGVIQPEASAAVSSTDQARHWQATQLAPALPSPALPSYEQQPDSQQSWSFQPVAAPFQSRTPEPISASIAPPPPVMSSPFAPASPVPPDPFASALPPMPPVSFSMPWRRGRRRLPLITQILVIVVALFVVLGSGVVLISVFAYPARSTVTTAQGTIKVKATVQTTQTDVLPQSNPMATTTVQVQTTATAQAQIIAAAQAQGKPQLLWTFTTGDVIFSSPNVVNGVAYVGSNDGTLYAINTITAQQKWSFLTQTGNEILSLPAVVNGVVYVGAADDKLYAIDATTGQQKWAFMTGSGISASPTVVNGIVYITSGDGKLYAVDATTGQQKWTFTAGGPFWRSLTVANGVVYAGSIDHKLYAIDATTGQQKWAFRTANNITASPTIAHGVVYVGSADDKLYAIDAITGQQKWAFMTGDVIWSAPTMVNGVVYVGSHDHKLYAIDAATGQQKWAFLAGDRVWSSPTLVNGVVYVGSMDHKLYAIDAASGQQKWAFTTGNAIQYSSPMVVNGVVYIGSNDHKVYAIATGE